jgi:hypothetical protein
VPDTIPTQSAAHATLARLHKDRYTTADLAVARSVMTAARLKQQITKILAEGEPITAEHRQELADLIRGDR